MRKAVLFSLILSLVYSVAAPAGVAFALDDIEDAPLQQSMAESPLAVSEEVQSTGQEETIASVSQQAPVVPSAGPGTGDSYSSISTTATQPSPIVASDAMVVSAFQLERQRGFRFIELRNTTSTYVKLNDMSIRLLYSTSGNDYDCTIVLDGYAQPNSYISYTILPDIYPGAYSITHCPLPNTHELFDVEIRVYRANQIVENVRVLPSDRNDQVMQGWERKGFTASVLRGVLSDDFKVLARSAYVSEIYQPPEPPSLQFLEIFPRSIPCSIEDTRPVCAPYVKIKNTGNTVIDLADFRLRSGSPTSASSRSNTSSLAGVVAPGDFKLITRSAAGSVLALNGQDGATWLEDRHGLVAYANNDTPYADAELVGQRGRSWAYDSELQSWRWGIPSPYSEQNVFPLEQEPGKGGSESGLKPCRDDQYRSEETNRCRNLTSSSDLKPCKEGQYRSEETNRCRSIASAAARVLKPCADDQYRSPETNRCRKIASADDLKDCGEGRERNPATNRCRNVVRSDVPAAAFGVEPIKDSATVFMGWWALGGIMALALGYAGWEWRREIIGVLQKATMFLRR